MIGARLQPQGGPVRLSQYAKSLGFTHAFNFGSGTAGAANVVTGAPGISLVSGARITGGSGGQAVQFNGTLGDRLEVAGNPFATSTCTYLWLDSGVDATQNGQAVTASKYGNTNLNEQFGIQVRVQNTSVAILAAQLAVKFSASNCRDNTGKLNALAVSIAGDNGRHAVFSGGRLVGSGTPGNTSNYQHGISAIGGAFDVTSSTVKYYSLLFAPKAIPDDALRYLTANPWAMYADSFEDYEYIDAATPQGGPVTATPGTGAITISGFAPSIVRGVTTNASPSPASLTVTGYAPAVSQTAGRILYPQQAALGITGYAPTVARGGSQTIPTGVSIPSTVQLTGYAPTVFQAPPTGLIATVQYRYMPRSKLELVRFA